MTTTTDEPQFQVGEPVRVKLRKRTSFVAAVRRSSPDWVEVRDPQNGATRTVPVAQVKRLGASEARRWIAGQK